MMRAGPRSAPGRAAARRSAAAVIALLLASSAPGCLRTGPRPIVVGSKNFTEQVILAEILARAIEAEAGLPVDRRVNLGGTLICHRALVKGELDLYVEYTGTALTAVLGEPPSRDPGEVRRRVREEYARRFDLEWLPPLGFDNTFAIVVRGEDARRLNLRAISDLAPHAGTWRPGFGYEFSERPDGYAGLIGAYGLRFASPPRTMDLGLIYRALRERQVDVVAGNATDGAIAALDLVVLEDDRGYFPPYEAAAVVGRDLGRRHPRAYEAARGLSGTISAEAMRRMNRAVDVEKRSVREVVEEWRRARAG
jgi:glycine betaine/choline ABC-type transport system substrate-binding protein